MSSSSIILQSLINATSDKDIGGSESNSNETNLLNLSVSKKSIRAGYLIFKSTKRIGDNNTKKDVKAIRGFNYLTLSAKKAFNLLWHAFTQAPILQYFNSEWNIRIKTNASSHAIDRVLSQLTLDNSNQWHSIVYYLHKEILAKT